MPKLTLPATLESLEPMFEFIRKATPATFSEQVSNIELVAEELLVNVFSYAYPEGGGQAIVELTPKSLEGRPMLAFVVHDWGKPFNPFEEVRDPDLSLDLESRPVGGLGVFLIRNLTEKQLYSYENKCNTIEVLFAQKPKTVTAPEL